MWERLIEYGPDVLAWAFGILGATLTPFIIQWAQKLAKKAGIELTEAQEAQLREWTEQAIRAAEEAARRRLIASAPKMQSSEKRDLAIGLVLEKATDKTAEEVGKVIDAVLPEVREAAAAALVTDPPKLSLPKLSPTPGYAGTVR